MARIHVFADEAGNFDFSRKTDATRYFILTTATMVDCKVGDDLLALRRELRLKGLLGDKPFHASEDKQAVRDRVFEVLSGHNFRVDATVLEKSKSQPHTRSTDEQFYKLAWYLHFKHIAPRVSAAGDELLVVSASVGTRKRRETFRSAVEDVARQVTGGIVHSVAAWDASSDPCLQAVDYCSWAIQRKWERGDARSHRLVASKISTEFDVFAGGLVHHY